MPLRAWKYLKPGVLTISIVFVYFFLLFLILECESKISVQICKDGNDLKLNDGTGTNISFINYQNYNGSLDKLQLKLTNALDSVGFPKGNFSKVVQYCKTGQVVNNFSFDSELNLLVGNLSYPPTDYCVSIFSQVFRCEKFEKSVKTCTLEHPCVRKCCGVDSVWNIGSGSCTKLSDSINSSSISISKNDSEWKWQPIFYNLSSDSDCVVKLDKDNVSVNMEYELGVPENCFFSQEWNVIPSRNLPDFGLGRFRILVNGSVLMNYDNGSWIALREGTFCTDEIFTKKYHSTNLKPQGGRRPAQVLLVCKDEYQMKGPKKSIPLKYAMMLYSAAVVLVFTVIVYLLIWDRHNIYEWTVFFEVLSMIFMIVCVAVSHTFARDPSDGHLGSVKCVFLGIVSHYFFLATFFWLFVINFEIWWNFRTLTLSNKKSRKWLRLFNYQIFAWGGPTMIVFCGWLLDKKFGLQNDKIDCTSLIVPNYGQLNCYISKRAQGPYLYFPIGVLLGFNLLFYTLTVLKMCQYQKTSQQMAQNKSNGHFQPVVVFARLFIVMGVSWIFEIVAWALSPRDKGKIPLYWVVFDIVTLVQAIAIFVIFVCRKEILKKLGQKYPKLKPYLGPVARACCGDKNSQNSGSQIGGTPTSLRHRNINNLNNVATASEPQQIDLNLQHFSDLKLPKQTRRKERNYEVEGQVESP